MSSATKIEKVIAQIPVGEEFIEVATTQDIVNVLNDPELDKKEQSDMIAKLMQDNVVLKQKTGDGCYSIISRIPHPGIGDPLTNGSLSAAKSKKMWKHNETKQLIDVRMSWQDKFSFAKNHRLFWQQICELLLEDGVEGPLDPSIVENKWNALVKKYKSALADETGKDMKQFAFKEEFDAHFSKTTQDVSELQKVKFDTEMLMEQSSDDPPSTSQGPSSSQIKLENISGSGSKCIKIWKKTEAKLLVHTRISWQKEFASVKNHRMLWRQLCVLLLEYGVEGPLDPMIVENKWHALCKRYKFLKMGKQSRSGKDINSFPFKDEFDAHFSERVSFLKNSSKSSADSKGSTSTPSVKTNKRKACQMDNDSNQDVVAMDILRSLDQKMDNMAKDMRQMHDEKMQRMDRFLDLFEQSLAPKKPKNTTYVFNCQKP